MSEEPHITEDEPTSVKDGLIGKKVGEYVIQRQIGGGGMGVVYVALQPVIGRRVALKFLRTQIASSAEHVQRLLAEARAANAIRHRGIIDVFGYGELPGVGHYIVMEFLEGHSLEDALAERRRLPESEVLWILDEVLDALEAAHAVGVVHRDLKPSNIFVVPSGKSSKYVKLLDFGLAKRTQPTPNAPHTVAGSVVGTPEYLSPEQATASPVGPATDLYSLGIVAYELLTGDIPFTGDTPSETIAAHVHKPIPHVRSLRTSIDPSLDKLIYRMMTKVAKDRPASGEVRAEIRHIRKRMMEAQTRLSPALPDLLSERTELQPALRVPDESSTSQTQFQARSSNAFKWALTAAAALALVAGGAFALTRAFQSEGAPEVPALPPKPPPILVQEGKPATPPARTQPEPAIDGKPHQDQGRDSDSPQEIDETPEPTPSPSLRPEPAAPEHIHPLKKPGKEAVGGHRVR